MSSLLVQGFYCDLPVSILLSAQDEYSGISAQFLEDFPGLHTFTHDGLLLCAGLVSVPTHSGRWASSFFCWSIYSCLSSYLSQCRLRQEPMHGHDIVLGRDWLVSSGALLAWNGVRDAYDPTRLRPEHTWLPLSFLDGDATAVGVRPRALLSRDDRGGPVAGPSFFLDDVDAVPQARPFTIEQLRCRLQAHGLPWHPHVMNKFALPILVRDLKYRLSSTP